MASNQYNNKVVLGSETLIDLTADTVAADKLLSGYTAHDASGATITGTYTDSTFVVTVSYNDQTEKWEPDCTYAEIVSAYNAEKTITVQSADSAMTTDGYYEDLSQVFVYKVYDELDYPIKYQYYEYTSSGLTLIDDVEMVAKIFQSPSVTYTPTESTQTDTVTYDSTNYSGIEQVSVTVNPISSSYVGSGITRRSSTDLTASGATVTAPAGYYASAASKAVASGTAGTPTASKGTVSNHAISVTPSVTNTTGYITGGAKTGTAVSVSASELVSGTYTVDSSGTKDVTNYASASVATGGATASATKGTVSNHSVSVTPKVTRTAGWVTAGTADGTAVTVSASELVSGSETKTANGTYDVTNLAELVVNITYSTIYTGTGNPSSGTGSNGDVYLKTVS